MTTKEINELMANFLELHSNGAEVPVYTLTDEFKGFCPYKTTKDLKFHESLDWLQVVINKISHIEKLTLAVQWYSNTCYVSLLYKSQDVDGEFKNAEFSCTRERYVTQYVKTLHEVIGQFLGWLNKNPNAESDLEWDFERVLCC